MRSSVVIISNPAARGACRKKLGEARSLIEQAGRLVTMLETSGPADATRLAALASAEGPSLVIAAGGDGTINEVINGLIGSSAPMAILPFGTTNVLARELGLTGSVQETVRRILNNAPRTVSLGRIDLTDRQLTRYFCLMAGIGFDAAAVHGMSRGIKKISGEAAYLLSGLKNLVFDKREELVVTISGRDYPCASVIVGKASRYGGDFHVTPGASLLSPTLHACLFESGRRTDLLRYVYGIVRGTLLKNRNVRVIEAREMQVRGAAHVQVDGDYLGRLPARLSVAEDALSLIW